MDASHGKAQDGSKQRNGRRTSRMELLQESLETGRRRSIMPLPDLEVIWKTMDINGDGLITYDEFCTSLKRISNEPMSDGAITSILKEIDVDGSGLIDHMEFMDFFSRLEDMDDMESRARFQGLFCSYFVVFYTVISIIVLIIFVLKEIDYRKEENLGVEVEKQSKTLVKVARNICIVNLSFSVCWAILLPVLRLKGPACIAKCRECYDHMEPEKLRQRRRKPGAARMSAAPTVALSPPRNGWQDMPSPAAPRLEAAARSQESSSPPPPLELPAATAQEQCAAPVSYRTSSICRKRPHSAPALGRERSREVESWQRPSRPGTATGSRETRSTEASRPVSASSSREVRSAEVCSPLSSTPAARPPTPARKNVSPAPPKEPPPVLMTTRAKAGHYDPARFAHARHLQEDEAGPVVAPQFNPLTAMQTHAPTVIVQQAPHELSHSTLGKQLEPPVRAGRPLVTYLD